MRFLWLSACGLASIFLLGGLLLERRPVPPALAALACPALAARIDSADRIQLAHAGQVLWLERRGSAWGVARQGGYPVQPGRTEALIDVLEALRLERSAPGTLGSQGLEDPFRPGAASGTSVRVLSSAGATLCAVVTGPMAVRRFADARGWLPTTPLKLTAELDSWSQHTLPPLDPAMIRMVVDDGGLAADTLQHELAALPIADIRARPQVNPVPARQIRLVLANGTAVLMVGMLDGQAWLAVSGTSPWASQLAPYAFALPPDSPLAAS